MELRFPAYAYHRKDQRNRKIEVVRHVKRAYGHFVNHWQPWQTKSWWQGQTPLLTGNLLRLDTYGKALGLLENPLTLTTTG